MTQRKAFLTKEQSLLLRGIAIFLVLISHYAVWIGEIFHSDLLEYGLGRFGVYGVDLFFVVSGYGLVKSVGKKRINGTFLWKRFKTVYLPYLLIVGLITVYDGGISGMTGWVSFLTGAEYWYIRNILVFYLAFYVVYRLSDRSWVRMLLMAVCFIRATGTVWTSVIRFYADISTDCFTSAFICGNQFPSVPANVAVTVCMVLHVFSSADVFFVFSCL